jgi:hypothetical protein
MNSALSERFVVGGLRFFAASFLLGFVLLLLAPLDVIRAFCALALLCSVAGFALHLAALREMDPEAVPAFRGRVVAAMQRVRAAGGRALHSMHGTAVAEPAHVARATVDAPDVAD